MKSLIIAVILSLTVTGSVLANMSAPSFKGFEHFQTKFPQATDVDYKVTGQYTEVNFKWNGIRLQAFYDANGNPIATSRYIDPKTLPLYVQLNIRKDYELYTITEAAEFTDATDDTLSYYVTVAGPKNTYLLHVSTSGAISVFKKMKQ